MFAILLQRRNREFRRTPREPGFGNGRRGPFRALSCTFCGKIWRELPSPQREGVNSMIQDIKSKALDLALSQIEKQFGKGSIMKLGDQAIEADIPVIPTGSLGLDLALGVGGLPRGRVVEIYGPESSGKMTLALECIAGAQKRGGVCAFIDAEHSLDISYARKLGVSVEDQKRYATIVLLPHQ